MSIKRNTLHSSFFFANDEPKVHELQSERLLEETKHYIYTRESNIAFHNLEFLQQFNIEGPGLKKAKKEADDAQVKLTSSNNKLKEIEDKISVEQEKQYGRVVTLITENCPEIASFPPGILELCLMGVAYIPPLSRQYEIFEKENEI